MAEVKIAADSGGGSVGLAGPASTTSNAAIQFKLPVADGSANQHLKTDGSGNLGWVTEAGGLFSSYALIEDQKSDTTDGGTFTNGDWRTRDLNTEVADPDGIVSISSNQFTLGAGSYLIKWKAPAHRVDKHQSRLRNITASSSHLGLGCYSDDDAGGYSVTISTGAHRAICSGSTVFEVQHRCQVTQSSYGFGVANDLGLEVYTQVEIYKEA